MTRHNDMGRLGLRKKIKNRSIRTLEFQIKNIWTAELQFGQKNQEVEPDPLQNRNGSHRRGLPSMWSLYA